MSPTRVCWPSSIRNSSWQRFLLALESDIDDVQAGTTKEGIHLGVMAGTLDLLQRGYLGTEIVDDVVYFKPTALERLDGLRLPLQIRRTPMTVSITGRRVTVTVLAEGYTRPITVNVQGVARELKGGESCTFELQRRPGAIDDIEYTGGKAVAELVE
jgi:trehalose/maltose hydrolase-like predicted phosphorylase